MQTKDILIIGGGGHTRVLIGMALSAGLRLRGIVTSNKELLGTSIFEVPVLGVEDDFAIDSTQVTLLNGVGNQVSRAGSGLEGRAALYQRWRAKGFDFLPFIAGNAIVQPQVMMGEGVQVMPGAVVEPGAVLGENCIINTRASIDHDVVLYPHCHVAPGAILCGNVTVGEETHIGAGAVIIQGIRIGSHAVIGAGAVRHPPCAGWGGGARGELRAGEAHAGTMTATCALSEEEILARVLYRDAMMLVLDKPFGIAVHVTGHDKIALDQSFHYLQFGLPKKPELAHRLDRGTSGCLVLGRHRQALIKLVKLFENQRVGKTYRAICIGVPEQVEGVIDRAILKSGVGSKWKMSLDEAGQSAVTEYRVLRSFSFDAESFSWNTASRASANDEIVNVIPGSSRDLLNPAERHLAGDPGTGAGMTVPPSVVQLSEIEFRPKTGRTHQIRLHAAFALGCPVVGDPFYGPQDGPFSAKEMPMMLHAETIEIPLQPSKPPIVVSAPLPERMEKFLATLSVR